MSAPLASHDASSSQEPIRLEGWLRICSGKLLCSRRCLCCALATPINIGLCSAMTVFLRTCAEVPHLSSHTHSPNDLVSCPLAEDPEVGRWEKRFCTLSEDERRLRFFADVEVRCLWTLVELGTFRTVAPALTSVALILTKIQLCSLSTVRSENLHALLLWRISHHPRELWRLNRNIIVCSRRLVLFHATDACVGTSSRIQFVLTGVLKHF